MVVCEEEKKWVHTGLSCGIVSPVGRVCTRPPENSPPDFGRKSRSEGGEFTAWDCTSKYNLFYFHPLIITRKRCLLCVLLEHLPLEGQPHHNMNEQTFTFKEISRQKTFKKSQQGAERERCVRREDSRQRCPPLLALANTNFKFMQHGAANLTALHDP